MKMPMGDHLLKKQKLGQIRVDPKLKCCLTKKWKKKTQQINSMSEKENKKKMCTSFYKKKKKKTDVAMPRQCISLRVNPNVPIAILLLQNKRNDIG